MDTVDGFADLLASSVQCAPTFQQPVTASASDVPGQLGDRLRRAREAVQLLVRDRAELVSTLRALVEASKTYSTMGMGIRVVGVPNITEAWARAAWLVRSWDAAHATPQAEVVQTTTGQSAQ